MANKKVEYEDDKVYRKNIDLKGSVIKAIEKLAQKEKRDFKPYVEVELEKLSKKQSKLK